MKDGEGGRKKGMSREKLLCQFYLFFIILSQAIWGVYIKRQIQEGGLGLTSDYNTRLKTYPSQKE